MSERQQDFPSRLIIEANNYCNLRCPSCITGTRKRDEYGRMELSIIEVIVDEVSAHHQCNFISLQGGGEPLMHPLIFDFVRTIHDNAPQVLTHISTNATLLTNAMSEKLLNSPLKQIYFSVDGTTADVYNRLRPGAKYEKVVENIFGFLKMKKERGSSIRTGITFVRQLANEHQVEELEAFWADRVDLVNLITYQTYTGTVDDERTDSDKARVPARRHACRQLMRGDLIIHWTGDVYGCCRNMSDDLRLGNVQKNSIIELFNGRKRLGLVEKHRQGRWDDIESCRKCLQEWSF